MTVYSISSTEKHIHIVQQPTVQSTNPTAPSYWQALPWFENLTYSYLYLYLCYWYDKQLRYKIDRCALQLTRKLLQWDSQRMPKLCCGQHSENRYDIKIECCGLALLSHCSFSRMVYSSIFFFNGKPMQQKCWNCGHGHSYPTQKGACYIMTFVLLLIVITAVIAFNRQHEKCLQLKIEHYSCMHLLL